MSGKNKRPRRVIQRPGQSFFDTVNAASNAVGVNGQKVSIGSERLGDQYDFLKGLDPLGGGSSFGFGQTKGKTAEGGLASVNYDQPRGMFAGDSSYADLIKGMSGNSDLIALLKSLGIDWDHEMTASQTSDWNKQILDIILQQYANQEQRAYDRSVLTEQRTYDNPLNQLARLMGAGISRDAAIQILSRSASAGSGSSLIGSMGGQVSTGVPASQSELNGIQGKTAIANTVFGGISALSGLLGLGFSAPQAIQQTKYLQNQNALTQRQLSAYDSTGRAFSILNAAGAASDAFGSVGSAISAITNLAKDGNADAIQFIQSGGLDTLRENANFASQAFKSLYGTERASQDYASSFDEYLRGVRLDNNIKQLDASKISAEISLIGTQEDAVAQSIIESMNRVAKGEAEIHVLNEQGKWIRVQTQKTMSDIDLVREQITGQQTANQLANLNYEYNEAGFAMLKQNRIDELTQQAQKWDLYMRDPNNKDKVYEQNVRKWLLEPQNAADAAYIVSAYQNAVGNFARNHPSLYAAGVVFHDLGIDKMLKVGTDAGGAAATVANLATKMPL